MTLKKYKRGVVRVTWLFEYVSAHR